MVDYSDDNILLKNLLNDLEEAEQKCIRYKIALAGAEEWRRKTNKEIAKLTGSQGGNNE